MSWQQYNEYDNHIYVQNNSNIPISASVSTDSWVGQSSSYYTVNSGNDEVWGRGGIGNNYDMNIKSNDGKIAHLNVSAGDKVTINKDAIYVNGTYYDYNQFR